MLPTLVDHLLVGIVGFASCVSPLLIFFQVAVHRKYVKGTIAISSRLIYCSEKKIADVIDTYTASRLLFGSELKKSS